MNIAMLLQMAAEVGPDRCALTCRHVNYSYQSLFDAARVAAARFADSGCSFVSVLDTSTAAVPVAMIGAAMAGIPYVPINYRLASSRLNELVERIKPVYLVVTADQHGKFNALDGVTAVASDDFLAESMAQPAPELSWPEDPTAIAVQLFTSGTTGTPKAALLRHEHLMSYILGTVEFSSAEESDATLVSVPPYHIAGISALLSSLYAGRRIVLLPDFGAAAWLELVQTEKVTNAFVVPTMLSRIIDHLTTIEHEPETVTLRAVAYGGGKMTTPVIEKALELFPGVDFTNAYGLTETSSTITLLTPEDHRDAMASDDPNVRRRLGSVGKPLPSVELEIRDEDGNVLGPGNAGEIYVRGPQVSGEYREKSALDAAGWFPTRDAGEMDSDGFLFLTGRADDVIVRGGENISPSEIEDVLLTHDGILDAAAVAVPSDEWGETVGVAVVLKSGVEPNTHELQHLIKSQLRSSRVPEFFRFEKELPYNEMGKLLRREIKLLFQ
jgi:acyl-CoA synthetase (AMP-forming)/AMP-acid ligase II